MADPPPPPAPVPVSSPMAMGPVPSEEDMKKIRAIKDEDLGWLPSNRSVKPKNRYFERMKENPLVPIGTYASHHPMF